MFSCIEVIVVPINNLPSNCISFCWVALLGNHNVQVVSWYWPWASCKQASIENCVSGKPLAHSVQTSNRNYECSNNSYCSVRLWWDYLVHVRQLWCLLFVIKQGYDCLLFLIWVLQNIFRNSQKLLHLAP